MCVGREIFSHTKRQYLFVSGNCEICSVVNGTSGAESTVGSSCEKYVIVSIASTDGSTGVAEAYAVNENCIEAVNNALTKTALLMREYKFFDVIGKHS